MQEKIIQNQIIDYLRYKGIFFYRNNSGAFKRDEHFYRFGAPGSPDIICVINGQYVGIEVKGDKYGKQSKYQKRFEEDLIRAGGKYILAKSVEDVIKNI